MRHIIGPEPVCIDYEALCRKALQLPSLGLHVGGGRHVTIPMVPPGPGWTTAWATVRKHPDKELYAVQVLSSTGHLETLSIAERDELATKEAAAIELDESWEPKGVDQAVGPRSL